MAFVEFNKKNPSSPQNATCGIIMTSLAPVTPQSAVAAMASMGLGRADAAIVEAMLQSGARVEVLGQYWSIFEWLLFAYFERVRVIMQTGHDESDIIARYLPSLADGHARSCQEAGGNPLHVAWCRANGGRPMFSADEHARDVNHFTLLMDIGLTRDVSTTDVLDVRRWAVNPRAAPACHGVSPALPPRPRGIPRAPPRAAGDPPRPGSGSQECNEPELRLSMLWVGGRGVEGCAWGWGGWIEQGG